jgi:hypothetical protein
VLHLDDAERAHLFDLARTTATARRAHRKPTVAQVRPSIQHVLDALVGAPAWISNERLDILAANQLCHALYSDAFTQPERPVNLARFVFLNPRSHKFFLDWDHHADNAVAILRTAPAAIPTTRSSPTWLVNSAPAVTISAIDGVPTTCVSTAPVSRKCTTQSSDNSTSPTKEWTYPPTPD